MSKTSESMRPSGEARWPDIAGRIEGETHVLQIRVYFEDTDCAGVVYHANFLKFCERARSDFIRLLGIDAKSLAEPKQGEPSVFVVGASQDAFKVPAATGAATVSRRTPMMHARPCASTQPIAYGDSSNKEPYGPAPAK